MKTHFPFKGFYLLLSLNLMLIISACEYEPKGIYEKEVTPVTEAPDLAVDLNFSADTLYLPVDRYITFKYSSDDKLVKLAYFEIDNKQLATVEQNTGSFTTQFSLANYQKNKAYTFQISFFRSSGSNSLADKLGQEGFVYSKTFIVYFEDFSGTANKPEIVSAGPENGSLKITWQKYTGVGFKRYIVWAGYRLLGTFENPDINFCFDPEFIGYETMYQVVTETDAESFRSTPYIFRDNLPQIRLKKINEETVQLHWNKTMYYSNITTYKLFETFEINDRVLNEIGRFDVNNSDTSMIYSDGKYGVKTFFYLLPVKKEEPQQITYRSDLQTFGTSTGEYYFGTRINGGNDLKTPLGDFAYFNKYTDNRGYIVKYNCLLNQYVDSIPYDGGRIITTPDGNDLYLLISNTLKTYDTKTMAVRKAIDISELTEPDFGSYFYGFIVSNTGIGIYIDNSGNYVYYDFGNEKELARFRIDGYTNDNDQRAISPDGQFFGIRYVKGIWPNYQTDIFQLKNGVANKIWSDNSVEYFEFDQKSNSMAFLKNHKLFQMSLADLQIIAQTEVPDTYFYDIDWSKREYLTLNSERTLLSIHDLDSGAIKAQKKTLSYDGYEIPFQNLRLFNRILFSPDLQMHLTY